MTRRLAALEYKYPGRGGLEAKRREFKHFISATVRSECSSTSRSNPVYDTSLIKESQHQPDRLLEKDYLLVITTKKRSPTFMSDLYCKSIIPDQFNQQNRPQLWAIAGVNCTSGQTGFCFVDGRFTLVGDIGFLIMIGG